MKKTWGDFPVPRKGAPRQRWKDPEAVLLLAKFHAHRANSKTRDIPFLLTFAEWKQLWLESGKWPQRGWRRGQYVMARFGDKGAYEIGNVKICLAEENRAERARNYPLRGARNGAFGKNYWLNASSERREAVSRQFKGVLKSVQTRATMSKTAIGRKRVFRNGRAAWAHPGDADFPQIGV